MVEFGLSKGELSSPDMTQRFVRTPEQRLERQEIVERYTSGFKGAELDAMVNTDMFVGFMLSVDQLIEQRSGQLAVIAADLRLHSVTNGEIQRAATEDVISELRVMDETLPRPSLDHLVAEGARV